MPSMLNSLLALTGACILAGPVVSASEHSARAIKDQPSSQSTSAGKIGSGGSNCADAKPIWARVKDTDNPDMVRRFIAEFEDCRLHTAIAKRHLAKLTKGEIEAPEKKTQTVKAAPKPSEETAPAVQPAETETLSVDGPKTAFASDEAQKPTPPSGTANCDGQSKGPLMVLRRTKVYDAPGGNEVKTLNTGAVLLQGYGIQGDYAVYRQITLGRGRCLFAEFNTAKPNIQKLHN